MKSEKRFLIFGGPGIGDTVIELSLAKALKNGFPNSRIDLIISDSLGTAKTIESILKCQDYIEDCYFYSRKRFFKTAKTIAKLRVNKYDYSFCCTTSFKANGTPSKISRLIKTVSIIKEIKGKTGTIDIPVYVDENIHMVNQYQELCRKILPDSKLDLLVLDSKRIMDYPVSAKRFVTICLGTNNTIYLKNGIRIEKNIKAWDVNKWICVANELSLNGYGVVMIGGKNEEAEIALAKEKIDYKVINLAGKTSIIESIGIVKQSLLVLGADTGMMHCAAALNIPTITLFGGTDPNVWRPYSNNGKVIVGDSKCSPCYGSDIAIQCTERRCMNTISVGKVIATAKTILEHKG